MAKTCLTEAELSAWLNFRFIGEETSLRVSRELAQLTGITGGQFGILNNLSRQGGELRQQRLADLMRWDRTRLSHQVTRMVQRNLVERIKRSSEGTIVQITRLGERELERIRPVLSDAVRKHYFARLTREQLRCVDELAKVLRDTP
jgi:DNA-binding MarR family transcriptional regulator